MTFLTANALYLSDIGRDDLLRWACANAGSMMLCTNARFDDQHTHICLSVHCRVLVRLEISLMGFGVPLFLTPFAYKLSRLVGMSSGARDTDHASPDHTETCRACTSC